MLCERDMCLMENAALIAGYNVKARDGDYLRIDGYAKGEYYWWCPLLHDGDALALATRLKLDIHYEQAQRCVHVRNHSMAGAVCAYIEDSPDCVLAATRRAIVMAAADILTKANLADSSK